MSLRARTALTGALLVLTLGVAGSVWGASAATAMPVAGSHRAELAAVSPRAAAVLRVTFVDVGQGDAIVLRSGSWTGLIDGGPPGTGPRIEAVLRKLNATHLDCLVISHPHADHIGGLAPVVRDFKPTTVVYGAEGTTKTWRNLKAELAGGGAIFKKVRTGDELQFGQAKAKVLSPARLVGDANADSVVIDVTAGGKQFLFTGDVTGTHETDVGTISARGPPVYLLKVAHHGSKYSTTAAFLSQVRPTFAVICVGKNSYGHPTPATISRLKAQKTRIYSTQKNGTVTLVVTSAGAVTWTFTRTSKPVTSAGSSSGGGGTPAPSGTTVYITNTGECYHAAGCRYLSHSCIPISLTDAKAQGYRPCSVCRPPT
jgi:competence protein ComEC